MRPFHLVALLLACSAQANLEDSREACGGVFYEPSQYTCYDKNFLCPILDGIPTFRCGTECQLAEYSCIETHLQTLPTNPTTNPVETEKCPNEATTLHLSSPPYNNYFYSDCHSASQRVVTSPLPESNLTIIEPRIIVAWPAGNGGIALYFAPKSDVNGSLEIQLLNSTAGSPLGPIYKPVKGSNATVGISTLVEFSTTTTLSVAILGSIRTIRDFVEGPSTLPPEIQDAIHYTRINGGVKLTRLWLDNITSTTLSITSSRQSIEIDNTTVTFEAGSYTFNASFNYPQLTQLSSTEVLNSESADIISKSPIQTTSLSFLSYNTKLTAGGWRFLTYFGRDSMIAALLMQPVFSQGKGGAIEAILAGVLERIDRTDGSVCHEETIGDYATWTNMQNNIASTAPLCDYKMVDSDYYLPVLMERYFLHSTNGSSRIYDFLRTTASVLSENADLTYGGLAKLNADKIVALAAPFAAPGNQTKDNLIHLKNGQLVGQWRDSNFGIGGGRIPYDVNTALVPAALRSIASLSVAGILDFSRTLIDGYAQVWEDSTLQFFEVSLDLATAQSRLQEYATNSGIPGLPSQADLLDGNVTFHALALDGYNNLSQVAVMNTDDCFRHFFLNTTYQPQLTSFLNSTANNIRRTFPAGLMTDVGILVANPAYGDDDVYAERWTTSAYHGTVVWSWQLAMMARGLELQLSRCNSDDVPDFCADEVVHGNVKMAYNMLWDSIEANSEHLSTEIWSWTYEDDQFKYIDLGALPPPEGGSPVESDIVQLWSLTFLAVTRNEGLR